MNLLRDLLGRPWVRRVLTLLVLVLVAAKINPGRLVGAVASVHPRYLFLALLLTIPFVYLKALRWHVMLRAAGIHATFSESLLSLLGGMGLALLTPARLGELVRAAYLRDPRKWKIGGLVLLDKAFDVVVLAALSIAGAWALLSRPLAVALGLATILGLAAFYQPAHLLRVLQFGSARLPLRAKLLRAWESTDSLGGWMTTLYLALTVLAFAVVLSQFTIILLNWRAWSPAIVLLTFPLVVLTNILPITIGGLGVREGVAVLLLMNYGVSPAHAALAAFLMFSMNTALPGLIGALLVPSVRGRNPSAAPEPVDLG